MLLLFCTLFKSKYRNMIVPMLPMRSPRSRAMSSKVQFVSLWRAMLDLACAEPGPYLAYRVLDHLKGETAKVEGVRLTDKGTEEAKLALNRDRRQDGRSHDWSHARRK
jgi:hypothetical protein